MVCARRYADILYVQALSVGVDVCIGFDRLYDGDVLDRTAVESVDV